ncbi:MAG: hypothetical protein LBQ28_07975 [Prevotellaceae bacterium]|jgi:hypothetical protein|nr:hypothetical protein [Prevotellaceae bacterium]
MKVLFLPEVRDYFKELAEILYKKDYFGFQETAIQYAEDLFYDIADTLPSRVKKIAPTHFDRYGKDMFYAVFIKNKHTQWYVFFNIYIDNGETVYLGRYISNNHVIAQLL